MQIFANQAIWAVRRSAVAMSGAALTLRTSWAGRPGAPLQRYRILGGPRGPVWVVVTLASMLMYLSVHSASRFGPRLPSRTPGPTSGFRDSTLGSSQRYG